MDLSSLQHHHKLSFQPLANMQMFRMRTRRAVNEFGSKQRRNRGFKIRTAINVTMGLAVIFLFGFDYRYMMTAPGPSDSLQSSGSRNLRHEKPAPTRYGFVQRQDLRTDRLHETDPFLQEVHLVERKTYSSHPRVISLGGHLGTTIRSTVEGFGKSRKLNATALALGNASCCSRDPQYFVRDFERPFLEQCDPMIRPTVHPSCNALHELEMESDITLIATSGSWRTTWKVEADNVVLKMLNYNREFDEQSMQAHAIDSIAMDRLTSSPYTVNEFGFCSQSVLTEWAPTGGRDHVKSYDVRNRARLKIARDLARGLADVQSLQHLHAYSDINRTSVFAHNDINIANTVFVDGMVKWNDFNIGIPLRNDRHNSSHPCGAPVLFHGDMWRSPEEVMNTTYVQVEQSDVYGFGNVLYQIMTRHQPW